MGSEWKSLQLGDICELRAGSVFPPALQGKLTGTYPFVKVSDMNLPANALYIQVANNWINDTEMVKLKAKPFPVGTTIFAKIGEALKANRLRFLIQPTILDNNMMGAIPTENEVDPRFFFYSLSQFDFGEIADGTALPYLTVNGLSKLPVMLPPLSDQHSIAHILGTLDDKIELNRRMNETLEAMARVLFKSWFVDFDPVRAKAEGRDTGLPPEISDLFPEEFEDSELGEIPKGWEVQSFGNTVNIIGGGTPKTSVPEYWGGDIPWFSVVDAPSLTDIWVIDTEKKITQEGLNNSSTKILETGTTIISARGTVGRLALVGTPMAMNQSCYGLQSKVSSKGYFTFFSTEELIERLRQNSHGSVFDTITRETFSQIFVPSPGKNLIDAFEKRVSSFVERMKSSILEMRTLSSLRDTLLPKLISGEIRVGEAEKYLEVVET